jgi:hypothetical protein
MDKTPAGNTRCKSPWKFLPYSADMLREHLEAQFEPGMNWDDMSSWHIDHIKPMVLFEINSFEDNQFMQCFSLKNLRPCWKQENISKGAKWNHPDQISFFEVI